MKINITPVLKKHILPNLPYAAFFYAFWKIHEMYHILPISDWLVGLAGAVVIRAAVYFKGKNAKKYRKDVEYGSARWGTKRTSSPTLIPSLKTISY